MKDLSEKRSIKEWPEDERPRERLFKHGPSFLSDAQLLAIILGTGDSTRKMSAVDLARTLIERFGSFRAMDSTGMAGLCQVQGIGPAKAAQVIAAFEIGKRLFAQPSESKPAFRTSSDVAGYYIPLLRNLKKEVFKCALLDTKNRILKDITVSEGSLTASIVHPREAFGPAIRDSAAAVIFIHNHPSGDPTPSPDDIEVTHQLVEAGNIIGIKVLDHIIVGEGRWISFVEEGII